MAFPTHSAVLLALQLLNAWFFATGATTVLGYHGVFAFSAALTAVALAILGLAGRESRGPQPEKSRPEPKEAAAATGEG